MGATLTQRPGLVHAIVSHIGIYDMLRVELFPNVTFNVTELATVANEAELRALCAYSPCQDLERGTRCPATLVLTGANDPRVETGGSCMSRAYAFEVRKIARVSDTARDALRGRLRSAIDRLHAMVVALG